MSLPPSSTASQVPEEIWAQTFLYLPRAALLQVNLAQRMFHRIAHPLVFHDFDFHPYLTIAGYLITQCPPSGLMIPYEEHIPSLLARLQFWSSPDIAPLVRTCRVSDWSNEGVGIMIPSNCGVHGWSFQRTEDPYILLTAFFDALPRFTSLRHLTLNKVHFTQSGFKQLALLCNLRILEVFLCSVVHGEVVDTGELASLHVTQFTFRHHAVPEPCVEHWIPLLNPQILTHLDVAYNTAVLSKIQASTSTFPCVKSLKIMMDLCLPTWTRMLSKFPAIEVLDISRLRLDSDDGVGEPHAPLRDLLLALREYTGPEELLQFLVPIPTLRRVSVPAWSARSFDDIIQFETVTSTANNVSSLHAEIGDLDTDELYFAAVCSMCSVFPRLTELHVKISENALFKPDEFLKELEQELPLPARLQKLALHWQYPDRELVADVDFGPPDLNSVKDALVAEYPDLKMIWVEGSGIMYLWRKERGVLQHTFEEEALEDVAQIRREEFSRLWDACVISPSNAKNQ
ncbi:hypothetical protein MSAN_02081000 [Mycena sanguinolenta]|uniref:F-box domain-containing protein n=1 Tax=Mycena sanguinolenta TaxID=230812 RepID=A0A8H6XI74_9AGAR|nr:hypothetical protein MSAN_02081000 [Mycena sanguinolenta]